MLSKLIAVGGAALIGAAALGPRDYSALPLDPADLEAKVKARSISLDRAVEIATKTTGGVALSAAFNLDASEVPCDVVVFADGQKRELQIDSSTGEVLANAVVPRFFGRDVAGEWVESDSGLKYWDIVEGDGAAPNPTSTVQVHYTGWLTDGSKFDSSVDRGEPINFPLNGVIPGWTEGVSSMKVGGIRKLVIPAALGYGPRGIPGVIPPNATLIFDVQLLDIVE